MSKLIMIMCLIFIQGCSNFYYYPSQGFFADPKDYGITYESFSFKTEDGIKLNAWILHQSLRKTSKGTVLFFHGNAENLTSHWRHLGWMTEQGYDVFIFDYRGYGDSDGKPTPAGLHKDALAALKEAYAWHLLNRGREFIVYAQSLGGTVALDALPDFPNKNRISLIVADSTFASYTKVGADKLASSWITWPLIPLAYVLLDNSRAPENKIKFLSPVPLLVIHGTNDTIVPMKFGEDIFARANEPKTFWTIENGRHGDAFLSNERIYRTKFLDFLTKINPSKQL